MRTIRFQLVFSFLFVLLTVIVLTMSRLNAEVFFEFNCENGYQYMGSDDPHPGGGYFSMMGGNVRGPEAALPDPCSNRNTNTYHYTVVSNDIAAQGAVSGSKYALKTPYAGHCNDESFSRDTTIINYGQKLSELYIRWYQKFTGNWHNGSVQHKFVKFGVSTLGGLRFGSKHNYWRTGFYNNGHWPGANSWIWVYEYLDNPSNKKVADDLDSGLGRRFTFNVDTWYCIEMHVKGNTAGNTDGIYEAWVDGIKVFGIYNHDFSKDGVSAVSTNKIELQHVYYNRATNDDQPTYMDNIIIADEYIGPVDDGNDSTAPSPPTGLKIIE